jgi:hypothetical protein
VAAEKGQASAKNYLNQGNRDVPAINVPKRLILLSDTRRLKIRCAAHSFSLK